MVRYSYKSKFQPNKRGGNDMVGAERVILLIIVYLVLDVAISRKFDLIALEKGHSGYFGWCFFLGVAGWAMVIALPDRKRPFSDNSRSTVSATEQQQSPDDRLPELE